MRSIIIKTMALAFAPIYFRWPHCPHDPQNDFSCFCVGRCGQPKTTLPTPTHKTIRPLAKHGLFYDCPHPPTSRQQRVMI